MTNPIYKLRNPPIFANPTKLEELQKPGLALSHKEGEFKGAHVIYQTNGKLYLTEHVSNGWIPAKDTEWVVRKEKGKLVHSKDEEPIQVPTKVLSKISFLGEITAADHKKQEYTVEPLKSTALTNTIKAIAKTYTLDVKRFT